MNDRGDLVTLEDQDRTRWNQAQIGLAGRHLQEALAGQRPGQYQIQAAIAGCHAAAPTAQATDWPRIARLYQHLADMTGSPVVELNRAVAVAMADGPAAGLALLQPLQAGGALAGYYLLPATRADFLRRLGRNAEAARAYTEAAALAGTGPERRFLTARLAQVTSPRRCLFFGVYSSASSWAAGRRRRAWAGSSAAVVVTSRPPATAAAAMR